MKTRTLKKNGLKLPVLYLVDSIVKNLKGHYLAEFAKNITILFVSVFEKAANQLGLTGANTTEVRRQQQHRTTPVKEDEETEPNPRMRCADSAEGDTAIVSELRATSRAGELQREGAGFAPGPKASDTQGVKRSLGGGASEFTSRTYRSEREELRSLKHSRESLSQVALDPRLTELSGPPCQRCPPRRHGPADLQNHPRQDPALFISPRRRDHVAHDGGHRVPYAAQPPHRARMPANALGDAPQPFQTQQSAFGMADFNRLMPAGTPNVFNSQRTPLTRFYHPGALAPSTGHTNAPVPAGSVHQGVSIMG
ncbi:hypothetical protein ANANG_G00239480 [Anguilla anguilla]|uniref:CID domain-containing protein n=1 Tax=Anguilla anguilla TaxID=7936 RepID=A0A9D3LYI2_ANGAN|nr:hypothetical protein ANANG_G00239480 [Anguilla anguilla]